MPLTIQIEADSAFICAGGTLMLHAAIAHSSHKPMTIEWYKSGRLIRRSDEEELEIDQPGSYTVRVLDPKTRMRAESDSFVVRKEV